MFYILIKISNNKFQENIGFYLFKKPNNDFHFYLVKILMHVDLGWLHWIWLLGILHKWVSFSYILLFSPFSFPLLPHQSFTDTVLSSPSLLFPRGKQRRFHLCYCRNISSLMLLEFLLRVSNQQNLSTIMRKSRWSVKRNASDMCHCQELSSPWAAEWEMNPLSSVGP